MPSLLKVFLLGGVAKLPFLPRGFHLRRLPPRLAFCSRGVCGSRVAGKDSMADESPGGWGRARGAARGPVSRSGMSGARASPAAPGFGTSFWKVGCGRSLTRMLGLTWYRHLPFAGDWSEPSEGIRGLGPACALSGRSLGLGLCPLSPCPVLSHCDRNINAR